MVASAELLTYLALAGNQRLPHLEDEIFTHCDATRIYVEQLNWGYVWGLSGLTTPDDNWYAYQIRCYATYVINDRWLAAEQFLRKNPEQWVIYFRDFKLEQIL